MPTCFRGRKEAEYLGVIVGDGALRTTPDKILADRDWPLLETQKQIIFLSNFVLNVVNLFTISPIVLRH
jgi:hypothetical protein